MAGYETGERRVYILLATACVAWGFSCLSSYHLALISKVALQFITSGITFFHIHLFFIWCIVSLLLVSVVKRPIVPNGGSWCLRLIVVGMIFNMAVNIFYLTRFSLDPTRYSLASVDRVISFNATLHTHVMKSAIAQILNWAGITISGDTGDVGYPFLSLLPGWISVVGALLVIASILAGLNMLCTLRAEEKPQWRVPVVVLALCALFACIKPLCDGGPLTPQFIAALPLLVVLNRGISRNLGVVAEEYLKCLAVVVICVLPFFAMSVDDLNGTATDRLLFRTMGAIGFLGSIGLISLAWSSKSKTIAYTSFPFIMLMVLVGRNDPVTEQTLPLRSLVPKGTLLQFVDYSGGLSDAEAVFKDGNLVVRRYQTIKDEPLYKIHQRFKMRPVLGHFVLADGGCDQKPFPVSGEIRLVDKTAPSTSLRSELFKSFKITACEDTSLCDYSYVGELSGCIPNRSDLPVINRLYQMGLSRVIIMPDKRSESNLKLQNTQTHDEL